MKILLIAISGLLLITAGFIPYWTGVVAEQQIHQFNQQLQTSGQITLLDNQHQRGWWTSQAHTDLQLPPTFTALPQTPLQLTHQIEHGLYPVYRPAIATTLSTQWPEYTELVKLYTRFHLDGGGSTLIGMPVVNLSEGDNQLYWQGLQGEITFDAVLQAITAQLQMPQLALTAEAGRLKLTDIHVQTAFQQQHLGWIPESLQLVIKTGEFHGFPRTDTSNRFDTTAPMTLAQASDLVLQLTSTISHEIQLTLALEAGLQQAQINKVPQGPNFIGLELRRLDLPALNAIQTAMAQHMSHAADTSSLLLGALITEGTALLNQQPELALTRLYFNTPSGELKANGQLKLLAFQPSFLLNPASVLGNLEGEFNGLIAHELIAQLSAIALTGGDEQAAENLLSYWLMEGWLQPAPQRVGYYQTHLVLEQGQLWVNGKQKPL